MLKLKAIELFITKIYIPISGFFGKLVVGGHWKLATAITIAVSTIIGSIIGAIKRKNKFKH